MRFPKILKSSIFFVLCVLFYSCASHSIDKSSQPKKSEIRKFTHKTREPKPVSPNKAVITGVLRGVIKKQRRTFCQIEVKSVLRYGSAVPPIVSGSLLEPEFDSQIASTIRPSENIVQIQLSYHRFMQMGANSGKWNIIAIEKNQQEGN